MIVSERELVTLGLALLVFIATVARRSSLRALPAWPRLAAAGGCLLVALTATVVEDLAWPEAFNLIEHAAYLLQAVFLAAWARAVTRGVA